MSREKVLLVFMKDGEVFRHEWVIKKGLRGIRAAKKVRKLQSIYGDPIEIIGDGQVACLLRKEYRRFNSDTTSYDGVSKKDILFLGAGIAGISSKKMQKYSSKLMKKAEDKVRT